MYRYIRIPKIKSSSKWHINTNTTYQTYNYNFRLPQIPPKAYKLTWYLWSPCYTHESLWHHTLCKYTIGSHRRYQYIRNQNVQKTCTFYAIDNYKMAESNTHRLSHAQPNVTHEDDTVLHLSLQHNYDGCYTLCSTPAEMAHILLEKEENVNRNL